MKISKEASELLSEKEKQKNKVEIITLYSG